MKVKVIAFGIAKDIIGGASLDMTIEHGTNVGTLKNHIAKTYPEFKELAHFNIAMNEEYAQDSDEISSGSEIVIIPPVSGG